MSRFFGGVAAATARRPWPVLILAVLLGAISIWAAGGMGSQNVTDAFFDKGSSAYRQTEQADRYFGTDPVVIMAKGPLIETLDTYNLNRLATLETCLAGRIKRGRGQLCAPARKSRTSTRSTPWPVLPPSSAARWPASPRSTTGRSSGCPACRTPRPGRPSAAA